MMDEIVTPDALRALAEKAEGKTFPVRGPDGQLIEGAEARVFLRDGVLVSEISGGPVDGVLGACSFGVNEP